MESSSKELQELKEELQKHLDDPLNWREQNPDEFDKRTAELRAQIARIESLSSDEQEG